MSYNTKMTQMSKNSGENVCGICSFGLAVTILQHIHMYTMPGIISTP